jgi:hypothetical protein
MESTAILDGCRASLALNHTHIPYLHSILKTDDNTLIVLFCQTIQPKLFKLFLVTPDFVDFLSHSCRVLHVLLEIRC